MLSALYRREIYTRPGVLTHRFRSLDLLRDALDRMPIGTRAELYGPRSLWKNDDLGLILQMERTGAGTYQARSDLHAYNADGTEFTIGTNGSGSDIERLDASAPTWSVTPGKGTGGLIFDGSGAVALPCLGTFGAKGSLCVTARGYPTVGTRAGGQAMMAGIASNARVVGLRGGWRRLASFDFSAWEVLDPQSPTRGGGTSADHRRTIATGTELILSSQQLITDSASNQGAYSAGAYSGDEASAKQNTADNSSGPATSFDDGVVIISVDSAAETPDQLLYRLEDLSVHALQRVGGATP
jgi:hypothetical protein